MRSLADKFGIPLSDDDLAKLGVLAALEAKAKFLIAAALKAVAGLTHEQFVARERRQLVQLVTELTELAAPIDAELLRRVEAFEAKRQTSHELRHKYLHALWGEGEGQTAVARDLRRAETLLPADLDTATVAIAELAQAAHRCAYRAAELIAEGRLREGEQRKPAIYVRGRWVNL